MLKRLVKLLPPVNAHCDLFCGVYDPAQARIEAQAVYNCVEKYLASDDEAFRQRCVIIKEERAQLTKEHVWVLWTDYFKPEHLEAHPDLHEIAWRAAKAAGEAKKHMDLETVQELLDAVDALGQVFASTKPSYDYQRVLDNL